MKTNLSPSVLLLLWVSVASAQLGFVFPQRLTNQETVLRLTAPAGTNCLIETSTNLLRWDGWMTFLTASVNQHTDSAAPYLPMRFYHAVMTGTNLLTGDHLVTDEGEVVIHPINHATFVMSWNGKMIYVDPVGGATPFQGLPRADLILVTHDHGDHYSANTLVAATNRGVTILAPQVVYNKSDFGTAGLRARTTVMTNGASVNVLGLGVQAVRAYNLPPNTFHGTNVGNGYILTIGNRRIYISGDTEDTPEMRALRDIDVAFIAMNQPYTLTVAKAVSAVREFRPKVVYPVHYRNSDNTYSDLNSFKRQVGNDLGIEVRLRKWY